MLYQLSYLGISGMTSWLVQAGDGREPNNPLRHIVNRVLIVSCFMTV